MSTEDLKWINTQIEMYENAINIAKRLNNEKQLEEYVLQLMKLNNEKNKSIKLN